jgi:hypothetical protein
MVRLPHRGGVGTRPRTAAHPPVFPMGAAQELDPVLREFEDGFGNYGR